MLINPQELKRKFRVLPKTVLHVGGHLGEESEDMRANSWGVDGIYWVESQVWLCKKMIERFAGTTDVVINATVWSESDIRMIFNENLNSQSSSLYKLGSHKKSYPEFREINQREVVTSTLDSLSEIPPGIDFVNLDIQGAELEALKGANRILQDVSWIYTEVNRGYVYEDCPLISEIDVFLKEKGFRRVATRWSIGDDWGDALYSRHRYVIPRLRFALIEFLSYGTTRAKYFAHRKRITKLKIK